MAKWGGVGHHAFVQMFRNGFLEAVESQLLVPREKGKHTIPASPFERYLLQVFPHYLKAMAALKLAPPYVASLSLLDVRGYSMAVSPEFDFGISGRPVDRDHLLTEQILVERTDEPVHSLLRPLFDQIWNGCGWAGSLNYDQQGSWKPKV